MIRSLILSLFRFIGRFLLATISAVIAILLLEFTMTALLSPHGSRAGLFLMAIVPTIVAQIAGYKYAESVWNMTVTALLYAAPIEPPRLLTHCLFRFWPVLVSACLIAGYFFFLRDGHDLVLAFTFVMALIGAAIGWICLAHGASPAPLPLWVMVNVCGILLWSPQWLRIPLGIVAVPAVGLVLYTLPYTLGVTAVELLELSLGYGIASLIVVLFINPFAVPYLWINSGASPSEGVLLSGLSLLTFVPPIISLFWALSEPLEIPPDLGPSSEQFPLAPESSSYEASWEDPSVQDLEESLSNEHERLVYLSESLAPINRSISESIGLQDSSTQFSVEKLEELWSLHNYPDYYDPPDHEERTVSTLSAWYLGLGVNSSLRERLHLLLVPQLLGCVIAWVVALSVIIIFVGNAVAVSLIALTVYLMVLFLGTAQKDIEIASIFRGSGLPLSYWQFSQAVGAIISVASWVVDVLITIILWSSLGGTLPAFILILACLRITRWIIHLHTLYSATAIRAQSHEIDDRQAACILLAIIHGAAVFLVLAYQDILPALAMNNFEMLVSVWFLFLWVMLPLLAHWLLIRLFLRWRTGLPIGRHAI